jgi:hypothetical protein
MINLEDYNCSDGRIYVQYRGSVICFQCPEMRARSSANDRRRVCNDCGVGINLDTGKLALAAAMREAIETVPAEITIKFFRPAV